MKLSDWPIDTNKQDDGIACDYAECGDYLTLRTFSGETVGELHDSIVEHARYVHGVELES